MDTAKPFITLIGSMELFQKLISKIEELNNLGGKQFTYVILTEGDNKEITIHGEDARSFYWFGIATHDIIKDVVLGDVLTK